MLYNNGTHAPSLGANGSGQDAASVLVLGTQEYLRGHGYSNATARAITGWTAPIYDGEYRIAFRYSIDRSAIGLLPFTAGSTGLRSDTIQSRTFQLPLDPAATTLSMNFRPGSGPENTQISNPGTMGLSTRT